MELITEKLLSAVSDDWTGKFLGAYNIRENGQCAGRAVTENIDIITKTDKPGIDIKIKPNTKIIIFSSSVTKSSFREGATNFFNFIEKSPYSVSESKRLGWYVHIPLFLF